VKTFKAMTSVYCYCFPETRKIIREISDAIPDLIYKVTAPAEEVKQIVSPLFDPPLDIPQTTGGFIDLDEIHVPIIDRIVTIYEKSLPALGNFSYRYPTPGSSEGIFKLLTGLKVTGTSAINVIDGDYEGYQEYGGSQDLGLKIHRHNYEDIEPWKIKPGVWFISNPSARDGNIIPNEFVRALCDQGHTVYLDLAYVGATREHMFDIDHENIPAVVLSFSKPYGVFRFRIGGFTFSREPIHSLFGNKWFKDILRLFQALKLAEEIGPPTIFNRYRLLQKGIVEELNKDFVPGIKKSDCLLLSYLTDVQAQKLNELQHTLIAPYKRGSGYRFCLTPYFEEKENSI